MIEYKNNFKLTKGRQYMQQWIIGIIGLGIFIYIIMQWFEYKKVAVKSKSYAQTSALLYLFLGFMVFTGISSLSTELTVYLFSLVGLSPPEHFQGKAMMAYVVFAIVSVLIVKNKTKKIIQYNTNGDNIAGDKVTNIYNHIEPKSGK